MARTSPRDLDGLAKRMREITGIDFTVGWAYGRPRLYSDGESREVSPRLPSGQLLDWMHAYMKGWHDSNRSGDFPVTLIGDPEHPEKQRQAVRRLTGRDNPAGQLWYPGGVAIGRYKMGEAGTRYYVIPVESTRGWDYPTLVHMFPDNLRPDGLALVDARLGYEHSGQAGYRLFKVRVAGKWSRPLPLRTSLSAIPGIA
jgi:hypothetical protein